MNINWKLRLMNKVTLSALIGIVVMAVFQIASLFGLELSVTQEQILQVVDVLLTLLAAWGVIVDPTTSGSSDSDQALSYDKPLQDGESND